MRKRGNVLVIFLVATVAILSLAITGYLFVQNRQLQNQIIKPIPSVQFPPPTPVSTPAPVIDSTANWKTYTNPFGKFSFKYPPEFTILHGSNFLGYPNNDYEISPYFVKSKMTIDEWISQKVCPVFGSGQSSCSRQQSGPILNSIELDTLNRHYASTETIFKQGDTIYQITLAATNPNVPVADSAKQIYNQILSTFKFL